MTTLMNEIMEVDVDFLHRSIELLGDALINEDPD